MATFTRFLGLFSPVLACKMCSIKNIAPFGIFKKNPWQGVKDFSLNTAIEKKMTKLC